MTHHVAQFAPLRSLLSAKTPPVRHPTPDSDGKLLVGVAAQDALVALFDEFAEDESTEMRRSATRQPPLRVVASRL